MVKKLAVLALAVCLLPACASKQDLDNLSISVNSQFNQQRQTNNRLEAEIQQIYKRIDEANTPVKTTQANLWAENESMRVKIAQLQGQVEALQRDISGVSKTAQGGAPVVQDLNRQVRELQAAMTQVTSQLGVELATPAPGTPTDQPVPAGVGTPGAPGTYLVAPVTPAASAPEVTPAPKTAAPIDTADALYKKAMMAFQEKKYGEAQSMFGELAANFPKHSLTPNAIFWQGESYYQAGDYSKAVLVYQDVITKFPKHQKASVAMLKQGMGLYKLGKKDVGKAVLKTVTDKYPGSVEAKRAKEFMKNN